MIKIAVLGSNVTHEAFNYLREKDEFKQLSVSTYIARQGITSALSEKERACVGVIGKTKYQNEILHIDIDKLLFEILKKKKADYLMLDFIDERFDLIQIGGTYITGSYELLQSGYLTDKSYQRISKIKYRAENVVQFRKEIHNFCIQLLKIYQASQIIIHEAYYAEQYYDKSGKSNVFMEPGRKNNCQMNALLQFIYEEVKVSLPGCKQIKIADPIACYEEGKKADPLHYTKQYYEQFTVQLGELDILTADDNKRFLMELLNKKTIDFRNLKYISVAYSSALYYGKESLNVYEIADKAVKGEIVLRTRNVVKRSDDLWNIEFSTNIDSNKLYFYGMDWVGTLVYSYEMTGDKIYYESADWYIRTFISWYQYDSAKVYFPYSCDHAYYLRVGILLYALKVFPKDWSLVPDINKLLVEHLLWLIQEENFQLNNHGVMSTIAIWYMGIYLHRKEIKKYIGTIAMERTMRLIEEAFDEEGMSNENSPEYFEYNITLFRNIVDLLRYNHLYMKERKKIEAILQRVEKVEAVLIRQDGKFPNIGDSTVRRSKYNSVNGNYYFQISNMVVLKDPKRYFTYKCGYTSLIHKHADDLSFTLRYLGVDIIVDCGLYCYDKSNVIRQYIESGRGHAKSFPESMAEKISVDYGNQIVSAEITKYEDTGENIRIESKCMLLSDMCCYRNIQVQSAQIMITDRWEAICPETMYINYPLHPDTVSEPIRDRSCTFLNKNISFTITYETDISEVKAEMKDSWYSECYEYIMESKCFCINVSPTCKGEITTILNWKEIHT